jgi:hypothetical protein
MSSIVKLQNGDEIATDDDPRALADRFDMSRRDGTLTKLDRPDDDPIWVNPHVLSTIEVAPESHGP